jgi:hypothetical protein
MELSFQIGHSEAECTTHLLAKKDGLRHSTTVELASIIEERYILWKMRMLERIYIEPDSNESLACRTWRRLPPEPSNHPGVSVSMIRYEIRSDGRKVLWNG